eukprot:g4329.t1
MVTRVVFVPFLFCTAVFVDATSATGLRYRPGLKVVNHVETLGMAGTSYSPYSKVRDSNPMKNIDVPMVPFQPLQPGQSVRGDDSFPLASPMQTAPYPFTAKAPEVEGIGGITDKEGMRIANNDFVQAPDSYIEKFDNISPKNETCGQYDSPGSKTCTRRAMRKTIAATVSNLDDGIKTVVDALKRAGMYEDTLIIYSSDNGGPPNGTNNNMMNNFPLRSGKGSSFEGGIRAAGFIHGKGLQRTGINNGLFHVTDWYKTLLQAAAGATDKKVRVLMKENEMPWKDGDGLANWNVLSSADPHAPSVRTELVIAAQAEGSDLKTHALRQGDFKIIWNANLMYGNNWWYLPPGKAWNYSDSLTIKCSEPPKDISDNICDQDFPRSPCLYNISADPCEHHNLARHCLTTRWTWSKTKNLPKR